MADRAETESDFWKKTCVLTQIDLAQRETDPRETANLKHLAECCERHLHKLLQDEEAQDDIAKAKDGHWASCQFSEFNLWCVKVGVHDEGLRSIDIRLKDVPEICNLLGHLLQSLKRDLNELEQLAELCDEKIITDNNVNDDEDDVESDASTLSFEALSSAEHSEASRASETPDLPFRKRKLALQAHIEDTIDRLHGHALRIDDAGASHRRRRVELYRRKEGPSGAYDGFKALALHKARLQFKKAAEPFLERLAQSFARRRIRFEYLREHQTKRTVNTSEPERTAAPVYPTEPAVQVVEEQKAPESRGDGIAPSRSQDQRTVYSGTVQTKLNLHPEPKRLVKAESVASVALRNRGFPPPPRCVDGSFQCPYCRLQFRSREAEGGRWSQHVMRDFEPYFCVWEDCNAPFDIPNTFEGLLSHLQSHVDVQYHVDMPDGEHKTFDEEGFETHVAQHGDVSEEMLTAMKEASRHRAAFMFENCPFCGGFPDEVEKRFPDRDGLECQSELRKHIKQHMQEAALFFPPFREDILDEDEDLKSLAASHRPSVGQSIVEDAAEFLDICHREDCDCKRSGLYDDLIAAVPDEPPTVTLWDEYFPRLPRYDPSPVQNDYYRDEVNLQPFVVRAQGREATVKLQSRFEQTGSMVDLDEAITVARQAVDTTPTDHPNWASLLNSLGNALRTRFERTGSIADLNEAITVARQAVESTPIDHPDWAALLSSLGNALRSRSSWMGSIADLNEAITVARQAVDSTPADDPGRAGLLSSLGNALRSRFELTGFMADLEEAITVARQAVDSTPTDHPDRAALLSGLGNALRSRFELTGFMADLEEAITVARQAVDSTPTYTYHRDRAALLSGLGNVIRSRSERTGSMADLEEATMLTRRAVDSKLADHRDRVALLNHLENALHIQSKRTESEEAITADKRPPLITAESFSHGQVPPGNFGKGN